MSSKTNKKQKTSPSSQNTRTTNELELGKKIEILQKIDLKVPYSKLALEYNIGKGTITNIKKNREELEAAWQENKSVSAMADGWLTSFKHCHNTHTLHI
jgi:DNA invertase Pin-like site-specific DNA recombinase